MRDHVTEALTAIGAAPTKADLDAVYAPLITALILNGTSSDDLEQVARAWQTRSLQLLNQAMGGDQP